MAKLSKADQKIIDDNPGLKPVELLDKGLTQKAYNDLVNNNAPIQPEKPTPTVKHTSIHQAAQPVLREYVSKGEKAYLVNKETGKRTPMSRKSAERFANKYPQTHYVI